MLTNTAYRIHCLKKLTIGFFGGSITEGAGASVWDETSWRARITKHLREIYPETEINAVNAAIGGTGTDLGLYRCGKDLLNYNPNLVFIEFAVNDQNLPYEEQVKGYESCLRQILEKDPTTEIVCVFTATKSTEEKILKLGHLGSRTAQTILAYHYGLDMVDIGDHLRLAVAAAGGDWKKYTTDETHPNDDGYAIYTEVMKKALENLLSEIPDSLSVKEIPAPYAKGEVLKGTVVEAKEFLDCSEGFSFVDKPFKKRFPYYVSADEVGSTMTVNFEGSVFGLYWIQDNETGTLEVTVDDKETVKVCGWDEYCPSFSRAGYQIVFKDLEAGKHTVTLRVSEEKAEESLGHKISIFAFLIS